MNWWRVCVSLFILTAAALAFPKERHFRADDDDPDFINSSSEKNLFSRKSEIKYNTGQRPRNPKNQTEPVNIEVNFYLKDVEELDNFRQDVKLQLTFRQEWQDDRLKFESNENSYITLTNINLIWTPDTFIGNERNSHYHDLLKPNILIRVYPNGRVFYSTRLTAVVKCIMDFHDYPFDRQECSSIFASYGYTTDDVTYSWRSENPVTITKNPHSPPFDLEHCITEKCAPVQTKTGKYDCLRVAFIFKRNAASILLKTYFPAAVFVVVSWMSFWMAAKFISARCMVLVTSLVSTTLVYFFIVDSLPAVNYTRSMDRWMWACIAFIFAAIVEFLIVISLTKKQEEAQTAKVEPFTIATQGQKEKKVVIMNLKEFIASRSPETWSLYVDKISRVIFPLGFTLFLIIYFVHVKRVFDEYEKP